MRITNARRRGLAALLGVVALTTAVAGQNFRWPPSPSSNRTAGAAVAAAAESPDAATWPADSEVGPMPVATVTPATGAARAPVDWRILENPNGPHTALFFDPSRQVFAVYHVDSGSGQIMLKSIRNLSADLRLDQFNSSNPAPKDIEAMLQEAR